jgi:two-component system chemotaxis response regulator CheB
MIKAIAIGASYGGLEAIKTVVKNLPHGFKTPIFIVLHIGNNKINTFISLLNVTNDLKVKEAEEKEVFQEKTIYFAPPNYHLQIEDNQTLSLSTAEKVNFSRPSIDVLFETAAWTFGSDLIGILLTGSNSDGAAGLKTIKDYGGITIIENPETALAKTMPQAGLKKSQPDFILNVEEISQKITEIIKSESNL